MPRARTSHRYDRQAAVAQEDAGGCLSFYILPPFAVVLIACLLTALALKAPIQTSALPIVQPTPPATSLSPIFTREVQHWGNDILRWANAASLDPNLVATVMQIESCGDPRALSGSGAIGLFQVMPYHFTPSDAPYDPDTNARRGLAYLVRSLAAASGDPRLALAGYNGGIGVIPRAESTWPLQTQRYAYWGSGIYAEASSGAAQSPRLQEWLETSGRSLCRQAARRLGISP